MFQPQKRMEAEASVGWGGTCLATPAALASQPPSSVDRSARAFWGRQGGEEVEPPNRSQKPHPYSISESLPQTGLGDKEGLRRMETRWTGQTRHRLVGHKRQQKGSSPCHMDTQIHTSPWRQPEQRGYRQIPSHPPQTHKDIHGHRDRRMCAPTIPHSGVKTSTDEHQETGREPFTDIDVGRLMGTKKHKQNTSCWKH